MREPCHRCGRRRARLRPAKTNPENLLCSLCWERFGGTNKVPNPAAGRRRARRQKL